MARCFALFCRCFALHACFSFWSPLFDFLGAAAATSEEGLAYAVGAAPSASAAGGHEALEGRCGALSAARPELRLPLLRDLANARWRRTVMSEEEKRLMEVVVQGVYEQRQELTTEAGCPPAVAAAAIWFFEERAAFAMYATDSSQSSHGLHHSRFHQLGIYNTEMQAAAYICSPEEIFGWPVNEVIESVSQIASFFQHKVAEISSMFGEAGDAENKDITDEQHSAALEDAAVVLNDLQLEWWPCRGTLIGLLRHGGRSGSLSQGRTDVVDHDVDLMVGVASAAAWLLLRERIEAGLQMRGWSKCLSRSSVNAEGGTDTYNLARPDLLLCIRKNPSMVLDVQSYITHPGFGDMVHVQRFCPDGEGSGTCYVPSAGAFWPAHGRLRRSHIQPLGRCRSGRISVPCPRRPLETLKAFWDDLNSTCIAVPDVEKRSRRTGVLSDLRESWQSEGLTAEDVSVLRQRSAELDAAGFMSMTPYFGRCPQLRTSLTSS
ncbi:unnamed protein product [Polarella glacialis]|uniref:Uncharacterized protein n=1 Tax=Polarella glacialis TaxID=89957 RepID=A0A813KKN0_POLGL|nr:unnamed protein product [Polarella glacialis]